MKDFIQHEKPIQLLVLFIIATIPLIFGATHPIIEGIYTFILLTGIGSWLIYARSKLHLRPLLPERSLIIPVIIFCYLAFLSLPLPLSILSILSPTRATSIEMVNHLAGIDIGFAPLSYNGSNNLRHTTFLFSLLLYYVAIFTLFNNSEKFVSHVITLIIITGSVEALYGLIQVLNPNIGVLWLPIKSSAAHGTIIYKNQYASFLNMCWPFALCMGSLQLQRLEQTPPRRKSRLSRKQRFQSFFTARFSSQSYFYFISSILMMLAVLFSYSRGGILSMCCILFFLILFMPFSPKRKLIIFSLFCLPLLFYSSQLGIETLLQRFDSIGHSAATRISIAQASLPIIKDHWLTGIGLDSYSYLSDTYIKFSKLNVLYDRVHNEYMELLIGLGIPVAFLFFTFLFYQLFLSARSLSYKRNLYKRITPSFYFIRIAAFGALLGFLFHGAFDFVWFLPANSIYSITLVALISWSLLNKKSNKSL